MLHNLKKAKVSHSFGTHGGPWIVADFLPYNQSFDATPYLEEIAFSTSSDIPNARFHIRLFEVNQNGEPGKDLTPAPLVAFAPKGVYKTITLDVSQYNLQVPSTGMFIAFEWLVIEENKHAFTYVEKETKKEVNAISFEPAINSRGFKSGKELTWTYRKGKWSDKGMNGKGVKGTIFQVTLSN
ncbi:hypothetical protein [Rufibacter sp. LB8]|uniref:hypothetical protein n=1 Tax=Rufibacter sp. LB8 TaxID=2777781 RepID=UPI00178C3A27|nr:hypothetical protein [Rufibacter sp. LB8]